MNQRFFNLGHRATRAAIAGTAAILLLTGAAWRGVVAQSSSGVHAAPPPAPTITHAVAGGRDSYADIVKVVAPAVVTIQTEGKARVSPTQFEGDDFFRRFFGDPSERGQRGPRTFRQRALGSGVIVSTDGYVLTNEHVVDSANDIRVELTDGRTLAAKLVGADKPSDLALLKVDATDLHVLPL